jgi:hypothetical protein
MPANIEHDVFDQPEDPSIPVWRYLDFTKFVSLLDTSSLYFATADSFDDPYEGTVAHANVEKRPELYPDLDEEQREKIFSQLYPFLKWQRQWTFISCWHMNEHESAAMWNLYSESNEAVAIQSRYSSLRNVLPDTVYIGKVKYIDYQEDLVPEGNSLYPFIRKRRSFRHEREARAIFQDPPVEDDGMKVGKENNEGGRSIEIDLSKLVETIYVSPTSADWFADLVRSVTDKYDKELPIEDSELNRRPVF